MRAFRPLQPRALVLFLLLALCAGTGARADDTELFATNLAPNVVMLLDTSGSMAHVLFHPAYVQGEPTGCNEFDDDTQYFYANSVIESHCGHTREIFVDPSISPGRDTRWWGHYLNWYFSLHESEPDDAQILAEIAATANGTFSACVGGGTYSVYRRSRMTAMQDTLKEVTCNVSQEGKLRLGVAHFRSASDPDGGYVSLPPDDYNSLHAQALEDAIDNLEPNSWTPLGESLFQLYTYFMSRNSADRPVGVDGTTKFPMYQYTTAYNGPQNTSVPPTPDSPVEDVCQQQYVLILTDGEPTRDDFDNSSSTSKGFTDFDTKLIGDYYRLPDGSPDEDEEQYSIGSICCEVGLYLDDIALYMQDKDFRPDLEGKQVVNVYTVGFSTSAFANDLLKRTADNGNGQFFFSNSPEELAAALTSALQDIVERSQSFSAASVPATRAEDGSSVYLANFVPRDDEPFWEGHLASFQFTASAELLDKNDTCIFEGDPDPCLSGSLKPWDEVEPFWDAQDSMPLQANRLLYVSKTTATSGALPPAFTTAGVTAADLGVTLAEKSNYDESGLGSSATTSEELADEIVEYVRGCEFGSSPCTNRNFRMAEIFHSSPLVVGRPNAPINEYSYQQFALAHAQRTKMIYAGTNGGLLHGLVAEVYDISGSPPGYQRENAVTGKAGGKAPGTELMGFMPYMVRQGVKGLPILSSTHFYGVDGSPQAADVWTPSSATDVTKSADEWRTVLIGGLRQGGRTYYALDVTDPDDVEPLRPYPVFLWEFPCEDAADTLCNAWRPLMGETWSDPIVTRVRVSIDGDNNNGKGFERWVAIFGAGYDPSGDPNTAFYDANAVAGRALFMVDVATGRVLAVKRFDAGGTGAESEMAYAIASTPSVFDLDADGFADVVYVGDLGGRVWRWSVRGVGEHSVDESHDLGQPSWTFHKFLEAPSYQDGGGQFYHKSFFYPPSGALVHGSLWLAFGSGERNNLTFPGLTSTTAEDNRYYVVRDTDPFELDGTTSLLLGDTPTLTDVTRNTSGCAGLSSSNGYFFRARDGEKFVAESTISGGNVFAVTFLADDTQTACEGAAGTPHLYGFDLFCGVGLFAPPSGGDPEDDRRVSIGVGLPSRPRISVGPLEGGGGGGPPCVYKVCTLASDQSMDCRCLDNEPGPPVRLRSWRQR